MGKPYDHQYFFAGNGGSAGTMVCGKCNQPIFNHSQDWMHYSKTCKDENGWPDWGFHCFHRKCSTDQSGWNKIEAQSRKEEARHSHVMNVMRQAAQSIGVTCPIEFADYAAQSLGESDLSDYYFRVYGSC